MAATSPLNLTEREVYIQACVERSDVVVKPEFLCGRNEATKLRKNAPEEKQEEEGPPPAKRRRGQNENRRPKQKFSVTTMCPSMAGWDSENCTRGERCVGMHNWNEFLEFFKENSPGDSMTGDCPARKQSLCKFGVNCCWSRQHIDEQGRNIRMDTKEKVTHEQWKEAAVSKLASEITPEIKAQLRAKTLKFPKLQLKNSRELKNNSEESNESNETKEAENKEENDQNRETEDESTRDDAGLSGTIGSIDLKDALAMRRSKAAEIWHPDSLILAPLTTVGNLPFRRLCVQLGADVTMSEMCMAKAVLSGQESECALLKRHKDEKLFGVQFTGGWETDAFRFGHLCESEWNVDFVDINAACPLTQLHAKMGGSVLMHRSSVLARVVAATREALLTTPLSVKLRLGHGNEVSAPKIVRKLEPLGVDAFTVHGRTAKQRYTGRANWEAIRLCKDSTERAALVGNGDIFTWEEWQAAKSCNVNGGVMVARGALIKPWIFQELKTGSVRDITSQERFDIMRTFVNFGLDHWGSDRKGVETTRRYLLEWCAFTHRYVPVGLLLQSQTLSQRAPRFVGRNELETQMASPAVADWVALSEKLLGPVPNDFCFVPKHRANN